jgi:hypothetical protein
MEHVIKWLETELVTAEDALDEYKDSPHSKHYWIGYHAAINNALDLIVGAEVYVTSETSN